jgi:transglutaminase-like putative cysteine protease
MRLAVSPVIAVACAAILMPCRGGVIAQGLGPSHISVHVSNIANDVYRRDRARYELTSSGEGFSRPDTPFQKVIAARAGSGGVTVTLDSGKRDRSALERPGPGDLADTPLLMIRSPEIKNAAARLKDGARTADNVQRFVYRHITNKMLGIPLVSALHVFRGKSGDCTEHTVLAVALLRAAGVPARAMVGMLLEPLFAGRENVFVYHMWAQAYVGGEWVIVDATRTESVSAGRYVAFAHHSLRSAMPISCLSALSSIQTLSVRYLTE